MRAIQFDQVGGPDVLRLAEVPKPDVEPGKVLIRNRAIGVNHADVLMRQGTYLSKSNFPDTPGLEAAGVIEAIGAGVDHLQTGMRVAALGSKTYAEYSVVDAAQAIPLPATMSFEKGAALPIQVLSAYHLLHTAHHTKPGQVVLIHSAAGGVGNTAVQMAKAAGARVIGTVSEEGKAAAAKQAGADLVINYTTQDFAEEALQFTKGRGVDLILDAVGKPTVEGDLRCLAPLGHLVVYGRAGGLPDPIDPMRLLAKSLTVSGFLIYTINAMPEQTLDGIVRSFHLLNEGKVSIRIGKTFPLERAAEAHRLLESRQSTGKLVLIP